jgi:hypothetical protein
VRWIRAGTTRRLAAVGVLWLVLTLVFEFCVVRPALGYSWERALSHYDLTRGGLMPLGLLLLTFSPLIASKLRGFGSGAGGGPRREVKP